MKIQILPPARFDLIDGYWFYEERESGLGEHFIESISADIDSLAVYGGIHSIYLGKYRMIGSKFPYSIFYRIDLNLVRVDAVLDNQRDSQWIDMRLNYIGN